MNIISPKYDFSAKELFSNEVVRRHFISDVLGIPIEQIRSVRMLNPFLRKCFRLQKQGILDFNLTDSEEYHRVYRLRDEQGNAFSDLLEVHTIELRKKLKGNGKMDDWIRLFNAKTEEDLDMIQTKSAGLQEAINMVKTMSLSKRMRLRYEAHMKDVRDRRAREDYVREEGHQEGLREGRQEGLREGRLLKCTL